jgi:hypothetical protein
MMMPQTNTVQVQVLRKNRNEKRKRINRLIIELLFSSTLIHPFMSSSSSSASLLFVIVGSNEPLFEVDLQASQPISDAATRQSYFVLHSALDLVERSASNQMYLKIVDKVRKKTNDKLDHVPSPI